jgi:hypothetical protein
MEGTTPEQFEDSVSSEKFSAHNPEAGVSVSIERIFG